MERYFKPTQNHLVAAFEHPYNLFTSQDLRYDNSLLLSSSVIYLLLATLFAAISYKYVKYLLRELNILRLILLQTINNMPMTVNSPNSTSVFFKAACESNPGAERGFARSN